MLEALMFSTHHSKALVGAPPLLLNLLRVADLLPVASEVANAIACHSMLASPAQHCHLNVVSTSQ